MKVKATELSLMKMSCRNDRGDNSYGIVVDGETLCQWVGIGWIELRTATKEDRKKYPVVKRR